MKAKILSSVMGAALALGAVSANAAQDSGSMTFTFSGKVPAMDVDGTNWSFVDAMGNTYSAPASISMTAVDGTLTDGSEGVIMTSDTESFYIKLGTGASFTDNSNITAALVSAPVVAGGSTASEDISDIKTYIYVNDTEMQIGTHVAVVSNLMASNTNNQMITLITDVEIPDSIRTSSGGTITVTAPVQFSLDITKS